MRKTIIENFKVGDIVKCINDSFTLEETIVSKKMSLTYLAEKLNLTLYKFKQNLKNPENFKIYHLRILCRYLEISEYEGLQIYFNKRWNNDIKFNFPKKNEEYIVADINEEKNGIILRDLKHTYLFQNKKLYFDESRFIGVKIKVVYKNFLGVGGTRIKNIGDINNLDDIKLKNY